VVLCAAQAYAVRQVQRQIYEAQMANLTSWSQMNKATESSPHEIQTAAMAVATARVEAAQTVSKSQAEAIKLLAKSTAEAHTIVAAAEAEAKRIVSEAEERRLLSGIDEDEDATALDRLMALLSMPYEVAYSYTMPDCHYDEPDEREVEALQADIAACTDPDEKQDLEARLQELDEPELTCGQRYYMAYLMPI